MCARHVQGVADKAHAEAGPGTAAPDANAAKKVDGRYLIVRYSVSRALNVTHQALPATADPGTM